jgi:hypothetical protein
LERGSNHHPFYLQASEMFHSALDKAPQHVVAQCGLGTALLGRARECISTGAFAWAATLLEVLSRTFFPLKLCLQLYVFPVNVTLIDGILLMKVPFFSLYPATYVSETPGSISSCLPLHHKQWQSCCSLEVVG